MKSKNNEATFRVLMDDAPGFMVLIDRKGIVEYANTTAANVLGRKIDGMTGKSLYDNSPAGFVKSMKRHMAGVIKTGTPAGFENVINERHIEYVIQPLFDENNRSEIFAVYGHDISAKNKIQDEMQEKKEEYEAANEELIAAEEELVKHRDHLEEMVEERTVEINLINERLREEIGERSEIEEKLQKQREEQQVILDSVPAWIFYKDSENRFIRINKAFAEVMGMTREQLEGASLWDLYPKEQAEAFWKDDLEVINSGNPRRNIIEPMNTGTGTLWAQTDKIPYRDAKGAIIGIIGFTLDITKRKLVEEELLKNQRILEETGRMAMVGGWEIDLENDEVIWSKEVFTIHEAEPDFKPDISKAIDFYHTDDRPIISEAVQKAIDFSEPFDVELRILTRKNNLRWVHAIGYAYKKDGIVKGIRGTFQDITDHKIADELIKKLNEELRQNIVNLETINKELDAFSYSVSHDLRAPLRAIDGFSKVLLDNCSSLLDDTGKRYLDIIRTNTQDMGKLIDDLLSFSRIGKQEMKCSIIDMEHLASDVYALLAQEQPGRNIIFKVNSPPGVYADAAMIRIVLMNLLSNAIKFTSPKTEAVIELGGKSGNNENMYYVKDNGVGFNMKYVHKLFGVFQRLHTKEEFEGTGVGLALVQRIIHRHGGHIRAEGAVNEGAVFYFTLPPKEGQYD